MNTFLHAQLFHLDGVFDEVLGGWVEHHDLAALQEDPCPAKSVLGSGGAALLGEVCVERPPTPLRHRVHLDAVRVIYRSGGRERHDRVVQKYLTG